MSGGASVLTSILTLTHDIQHHLSIDVKLRNSRELNNPSILNNLIFEVFTPNFVLPVAERVKQEPRQPLSDLPEADRVVESNDAEVQYSLYLYLVVTFI